MERSGAANLEPVEVDRNGLEILSRQECLRLLSTVSVGRVGVTSDALPSVLPVNFRLADGHVLFRTGKGTKLAAATRNAVVAFEVDDFDPVAHTGWSVMVTGVARELEETDDLLSQHGGRIPRWAPVAEDHIVAMSIELISGRRIVPGAEAPIPAGSSG